MIYGYIVGLIDAGNVSMVLHGQKQLFTEVGTSKCDNIYRTVAQAGYNSSKGLLAINPNDLAAFDHNKGAPLMVNYPAIQPEDKQSAQDYYKFIIIGKIHIPDQYCLYLITTDNSHLIKSYDTVSGQGLSGIFGGVFNMDKLERVEIPNQIKGLTELVTSIPDKNNAEQVKQFIELWSNYGNEFTNLMKTKLT